MMYFFRSYIAATLLLLCNLTATPLLHAQEVENGSSAPTRPAPSPERQRELELIALTDPVLQNRLRALNELSNIAYATSLTVQISIYRSTNNFASQFIILDNASKYGGQTAEDFLLDETEKIIAAWPNTEFWDGRIEITLKGLAELGTIRSLPRMRTLLNHPRLQTGGVFERLNNLIRNSTNKIIERDLNGKSVPELMELFRSNSDPFLYTPILTRLAKSNDLRAFDLLAVELKKITVTDFQNHAENGAIFKSLREYFKNINGIKAAEVLVYVLQHLPEGHFEKVYTYRALISMGEQNTDVLTYLLDLYPSGIFGNYFNEILVKLCLNLHVTSQATYRVHQKCKEVMPDILESERQSSFEDDAKHNNPEQLRQALQRGYEKWLAQAKALYGNDFNSAEQKQAARLEGLSYINDLNDLISQIEKLEKTVSTADLVRKLKELYIKTENPEIEKFLLTKLKSLGLTKDELDRLIESKKRLQQAFGESTSSATSTSISSCNPTLYRYLGFYKKVIAELEAKLGNYRTTVKAGSGTWPLIAPFVDDLTLELVSLSYKLMEVSNTWMVPVGSEYYQLSDESEKACALGYDATVEELQKTLKRTIQEVSDFENELVQTKELPQDIVDDRTQKIVAGSKRMILETWDAGSKEKLPRAAPLK